MNMMKQMSPGKQKQVLQYLFLSEDYASQAQPMVISDITTTMTYNKKQSVS